MRVNPPSETTPANLLSELAAATQIVVEPGRAYETYPYSEQPALLVVRDEDIVRETVRELAGANLTPGVIIPALDGLGLTSLDSDGDYVGSVGLLAGGWVRGWWRNDALLPEPLGLLQERRELDSYLRDSWKAIDQVVPAHAAAQDASGLEHAMAEEGTLCGLPPDAVEVLRHHFAFRTQDCKDCYGLAWTKNTAPPWPRMYADATALSKQWASRWGATPPVGHLLRSADTWVRFHSLPQSKRYAETPAEYDELLQRHHTLLEELAATTKSTEVMVLTHSWSSGDHPVPQSAPLHAAVPGSEYWASFQEPDDPENDIRHHVFINRVPRTREALDPLLRLVADDGTGAVIICDDALTWFFHPYDGGADLIPATADQRDDLKSRHVRWLPTTESGL